MAGGDFQPKVFYRKLDSLLSRIGSGANIRELISTVLEELVQSFGADLGIQSGCIYNLRFGSYQLIKGPIGASIASWPASIPRSDEAIRLLAQHKSYIFADSLTPPWGNNSVAAMIGEEDQFVMAFRLKESWERETLQFSLNTIRSTLNYSRSTSRFRADYQEAYEIQKSLLPDVDPKFDGYDVSGRFVPAERVGGDLYDFSILDEKVFSFAIGDASGHGLPAALLARDVVTGLRMGIEKEMKISGVMTKLNKVIHQSRLSTRFVSLVYGELEQNGTLVYINAGHPAPLLFKKDSLVKLDVGGTILGPLEDTGFKRGFAFMDPGDVLLLYTDGIFEVTDRNGEMYGIERLEKTVRENRDGQAREIIDRIFESIVRFGGTERLQDDATVLVIRRLV